MFFNKKLFIIFSLLISLVSLPLFAQQPPTDSCFDYYHFQSVQVSVGTDKDNFTAGDNITFKGELINENTYPIVDGNVFVRISEVNPNYITEGHYAVGEFIAKENISIDASSTQAISFSWKSPANLKKGEYRADYFFSVGKQFNLGGLPFTNEIIVGFDTFTLDSTLTSSVFLDRAGTKVNGEKYNQIGSWPIVEPGSKVDISQVLKNTTNETQTVQVSYDLYFWDSLNPTDLISNKTETVILTKGQSKTLSYEIPKVEKSVYYLKITAKSQLGATSILNVRVSSQLEQPRINFFATTGFPLKKGESAKIFSCFHNTSNIATEGKVVLRATDISGNEVGRIEYTGIIPSDVSAKAGDILANKNLTYLKLDQTLYDKAGKSIYQKSEVYDCKTLNSAKCIEMTKFNFLIPIIALTLLFVILSIVYIKKNKNLSIIFLVIAIVFAVLGALLRFTNFAVAENTSDGQAKTKSVTRSIDYHWMTSSAPIRIASNGIISLTHTVNLMGDSTLDPGETVSFEREKTCSFNSTGSVWDTPYCGSTLTLYDSAQNSNNTGYLSFYHDNIGGYAVSSNSSVVSCSGMTCTAVAPGSATVTIEIGAVDMYAKGCIYYSSGGKVCDDHSYKADGTDGNLNYKMTLVNTSGSWYNIPYVSLAKYNPRWTITVLNSDNNVSPTEQCKNGIDDDGDGLIDENDLGCIVGGGGTGNGLTEASANPEEEIIPDVNKARCGSNADTFAFSSSFSWPVDGTFCSAPALRIGSTPAIPNPELSSTWQCALWNNSTSMISGSESPYCTAFMNAEKIAPVGACVVSQAGGPSDTSKIYSNKIARLTSMPGYNSYSWRDNTKNKSLGSGVDTSTIFTSVGTREIGLTLLSEEGETSTCTTSIQVIQKPTNVIEQ
jgi:hypothetical protein